ncbi:MAG: Dolichyl-phosphate-mannose-protein mannosyltransferase protein [Candidatus Amesbacteria bacterium GW2011_GWA1_47_20]|uniref:Dolichyl-phosphate-mannose-protein mannosyltransferase protein n=1 Tax=Candidatus Amesbacteria bacterium GW2011_GWA1_47_20 TaxID=1618354 RepID=A0A0G1UPB3_9BACT|nr:MAG: Dolichyl-phosphate-mannose-protein mannosyltransferase protein [Candidatus Amesbacteria bacterium GW2011_GWA1_47_20]
MFTLAVFIGIYSYALAILGWLGRLGWGEIWGVTTVMLMVGLFHLRKFAVGQIGHIGLIGLIIAQAGVNLVGAMGPERGFDALWYHLPIPKIWLEAHKIFFIGGNLYYSAMPKLVDMLYVWGETPAKLMHLVFGLLSTAVTYKLARKWLEQKWALLAAVIFYSNLVVGWQSITAYIDLGRTFFEVLAFYLLVNKKIYKSAIVIGLALNL